MYVIGKYLLNFHRLKKKKIFIDTLYFFLTYILFMGGILISHSIFVINLFVDLGLTIGLISYVLLVIGFLLFVTEILLALSMERKQLTLSNAIVVMLMYFTYSQLWLILIIYAVCLDPL